MKKEKKKKRMRLQGKKHHIKMITPIQCKGPSQKCHMLILIFCWLSRKWIYKSCGKGDHQFSLRWFYFYLENTKKKSDPSTLGDNKKLLMSIIKAQYMHINYKAFSHMFASTFPTSDDMCIPMFLQKGHKAYFICIL